ncbi:MAG: response regulator [Mojavia pulchra JT2-VF2]|jgi:CheY-like chemotaxis protein|uniref:Response regulator n=1 Tax=Mojavia pulchra JT2-VF2 TaxID=287848 RepID=A0A951Q244_9NOST|nr:response regulator [Mojavia pulchra JT2-VF2]
MTARRILIVDDEEDIREVAQLTLEAVGGWEVLTAASGNEALATAASQQLDAILLDIMMPDLDGIATFQQLQANPVTQHIPVILLTAKVQVADRHRFAELGLTAMIVKPFDPMILPDLVADVLGWSD